jgi:invasion protein IalB
VLFILAYATLYPATGIAPPVESSQGTLNAWSKLCFDAPTAQSGAASGSPKAPAAGETVEVCYTYVAMRNQPTGILVGIIGVLHAPALKKTVLIALLPLFMAMPSEPGYLLFEDGSRIKLSYPPAACDQPGCFGTAELSQDLLERIEAAKALAFGNEVCCTYSYSVPLQCCGFTEAFGGTPVDSNAQDEMQRRVIDVLVRKFHDFIQ